MNSTPNPLRRALLGAALAAAAALPAPSFAQGQWPRKPIRLIVPFAAGGSNDNIARVLGQKLSQRLGQPFVVDNRGGSGGTIGTDEVARAAPDGHTLLLVSSSLTTNAATGKKLPYDPVKDLEPIGLIAASPFAVIVSNDLKATNLKEFIELARARPKGMNYGSAGIGGLNHLGTELFASAANIRMVHVPYKGISLAFTDLMGGSLQMLLPSLASVIPQIQAGKMRAIAMTGVQRSPLAPELPTVAESGIPGFSLEVWFGLMAPGKTPAPIVKRLNEELNAVLAMADVKELLAREGATPRPSTPAEFAGLIRADLARWTQLVRDNNIQTE